MRIAISGPQNSGKTTLVKEFINTWKKYKTPVESYRDILKAKNLKHSKETSEETQKLILDFMIKQLNDNKDEEYIIYDRCPLDTLVYSIIASEDNLVSDDFVTDSIIKVRDSLHLLDVIFVLPYDEQIKIEENGTRETNLEYIKKVDNVFRNLTHSYFTDFDSNVFFPQTDCPGIIPIETLDRIKEIKTIINTFGDLYTVGDDKETQKAMNDVISNAKNSKNMLENLISRQEELGQTEIDLTNLKI